MGPEIPVSMGKTVAVIMVGGPTKGTRFRPLSFNLAKPLFPLAGQPMVHHPVLSCKKIPNLAHIYLIGYYEERDFSLYCSAISSELKIPVRYLREDRPHGSAGGLYSFRDRILEECPEDIIVLNCDVCCSFPLQEMLAAHKSFGGMGTLLVKKVSADFASHFGELVADPVSKELLHYAEKPETFVSDLINCGVYIFTPQIFKSVTDVSTSRRDKDVLRRLNSLEALQSATKSDFIDVALWCFVILPGCTRSIPSDFVRLDQDILTPLAGKKQLYTFETAGFWEQIKAPGASSQHKNLKKANLAVLSSGMYLTTVANHFPIRMSIRCSSLYLKEYRQINPGLLAKGKNIVGDVFIHPSAKIHSTAKIGPNVSISPNARIGPGVRLLNCIILDDVEIMDNAIVMHAIVGWKSSLGRWARVQGGGDCTQKLGITILGEDVTVEDEVVVIKCIVLPHKTLNASVLEEIIL